MPCSSSACNSLCNTQRPCLFKVTIHEYMFITCCYWLVRLVLYDWIMMFMCACIQVFSHTHTHTHTCACIQVFSHTHTHTHIHTHSLSLSLSLFPTQHMKGARHIYLEVCLYAYKNTYITNVCNVKRICIYPHMRTYTKERRSLKTTYAYIHAYMHTSSLMYVCPKEGTSNTYHHA